MAIKADVSDRTSSVGLTFLYLLIILLGIGLDSIVKLYGIKTFSTACSHGIACIVKVRSKLVCMIYYEIGTAVLIPRVVLELTSVLMAKQPFNTMVRVTSDL